MHFYGIVFEVVRALPIYTFWDMSRNIDRIRAGQDKRNLIVNGTAFGGGAEDLFASLTKSQGDIIIGVSKEESLDRASFERMKARMGV